MLEFFKKGDNMKICIYRLVEIPDYEKKVKSEIEDYYNCSFYQFNDTVKETIINKDSVIKLDELTVLFCNSFGDLMLHFTLSQISDLYEKGIDFIFKNEPELSLLRFKSMVEKDFPYKEKAKSVISTLRAIVAAQGCYPVGKTKTIATKDFADDYWSWQKRLISTKDIMSLKNRNYSFKTTAQFYAMAKRYENTIDYYDKQQKYALEIIDKKKRGKIEINVLKDYITINNKNGLSTTMIAELKKLLNVNNIDLWRTLQAFVVTKAFFEIPEDKLKSTIEYICTIIKKDSYKSFFISDESANRDYDIPFPYL